jgi:hypothetical protein
MKVTDKQDKQKSRVLFKQRGIGWRSSWRGLRNTELPEAPLSRVLTEILTSWLKGSPPWLHVMGPFMGCPPVAAHEHHKGVGHAPLSCPNQLWCPVHLPRILSGQGLCAVHLPQQFQGFGDHFQDSLRPILSVSLINFHWVPPVLPCLNGVHFLAYSLTIWSLITYQMMARICWSVLAKFL